MKRISELLRTDVGRKQSVVFAFGRLNPPTIGHQQLIDRVITIAKRVKGLPVLYVSASQDKTKNPLTVKQKVDYLKKLYPRGIKIMAAIGTERTFMEILKNRFDKKYTDVYMVAGSDRVSEFRKLIKKYNGKDYNFDTVNVVSAGERDPDATGAKGMSASKMRGFATANDFTSFRAGLIAGTKEKDAMKLFKDLKKGMGVNEAMAPVDDELRMIRENYHNNEIFNMGDMVENINNGNVGKIIKRGPNYIQYEMEDGGVEKAWLNEITPANNIDSELQVEDVDKKKLVLQKNAKELKSFKSFEEEINSGKDAQKKGVEDEQDETEKVVKKDKKRKLPIETPGQPKIASVDTWTQGPENANQIHTQRKFNIKTPGQVRDYAKFVDDRKFQKFEGTIQISADPKKVKSLLSKHKVKISGKEKDLFLPRGMMDLSITGDNKSLKAFAKDFYSEGKDDKEGKKTAYGGQDKDIKDRPGTQPSVYYQKPGKGDYSKSTKLARARHFEKGAKKDDDDPSAYKPAPGDATGKTRPSRHTKKFKKMFGDDVKEEIKDIKAWSELPETIEQYKDEYGTDYRVKLDQTVSEMFDELLAENEGVKKKAAKSGMPYGILMKVYNRGMAAWRTGHRPGTTPQQWGMARVNSFVTKSSGTWGKADKDLAAKVRG
jgi:nicotinic acid mononucleotide adenylyltransferase